jgi:hypothetical protein
MSPVLGTQQGWRLRRWVIGAGALAVALVTCSVALAMTLADQTPVWWRSVRGDDPKTLARGIEVENRTGNIIYKVRPADTAAPDRYQSEVWTVDFSAPEANAWLNARLPGWLGSQWEESVWPSEMSEVQVEFRDGLVAVGARITLGGRQRYFTATIEPQIHADGSLWLPARWVSVGRLAAPGDWVVEYAGRRREQFVPEDLKDLPETATMFRAFAGEAPMARDAVVTLGDGRVVRLLAMAPADGRLQFVCRTEVE